MTSALVASLESGEHGVRFSPPSEWRNAGDATLDFTRIDEERGLQWTVHFNPGLPMDLSDGSWEALQVGLDAYAVQMFEQVYESRAKEGSPPSRTSQGGWSPLIEARRGETAGAPSLTTIHRMTYAPGDEMVMGHLLIPLEAGLFEIRVLAVEGAATGLRESMLMVSLGGLAPGADGEPGFLAQAVMDDAEHDAKFPDHPLTRVRAALAWVRDDAGIEVLEPATHDGAPIDVGGCLVTAPPGFSRSGANGFVRCSFCTTDGIENFFAQRRPERPEPGELAALAERESRALLEREGVTDVEFEHVGLPPDSPVERVALLAVGQGHHGMLRHAVLWFVDEGGEAWMFAMFGALAQPEESLFAELEASRQSLAPTPGRSARPAKPWWKLW